MAVISTNNLRFLIVEQFRKYLTLYTYHYFLYIIIIIICYNWHKYFTHFFPINNGCLEVVLRHNASINVISYEPADLTVHPPPRTAEGGFIFFV